MKSRRPLLGPSALRLLRALEVRLLLRALITSTLLSLAAFLACAELAAAALAFAPPTLLPFAEFVSKTLPVAGALAVAAALLPLARRPGRRYLAALAERARPQLAGSLILLAENSPGLDPGVAGLAAERADAAVAGLTAGEVARGERRSRRGPASVLLALGLGLALLAAGGARYLDALGQVSGLGGTGPTRIVKVLPGDADLEEGEPLSASCRMAGREPDWVRLVFKAGATTEMRRSAGGLWRTEAAPTGASYRVEAGARGGVYPSRTFRVRVRPRPDAAVAKVTYRYPKYTGLGPRTVSSAEIDCLQGTRVELHVKSRGAVEFVEVRLEPGRKMLSARRTRPGDWRVAFTVRSVGRYSVLVRPAGGGAAREVARGTITARKDLAPAAAAAVRELADGRLAVDYRVADDYRLGEARMVFRAGGRSMAFAVPEVSGRRESQGAVLVPREVLVAGSAEGFRYRLEAFDTHQPKPNRGASEEGAYRPPRRLASAAGPLLEKRPPQRLSAPPPTRSGDGGEKVGKTTRPMESLYKPDLGEKQPPSKSPPDSGKPSDPDGGEYMAPPGEEAPGPGKPPGSKKPPGKPGKENPENPGDGKSGEAPEQPEGPGVRPTPGGTVKTPGGKSTSRPGKKPGPSGRGPGHPAEKPPSGRELGSGEPLPERVIPEKVNMETRPGEKLASNAPPALRTDWGREAGGPGRGSSLAPRAVRAPDGTLRPLRPGPGKREEIGEALGRRAPVAAQYRRYVNEYLRALAAGER